MDCHYSIAYCKSYKVKNNDSFIYEYLNTKMIGIVPFSKSSPEINL